MKYKQLAREQFETLHEEFSKFLATQQIDVKDWDNIKKDQPSLAEEELNLFSDLVWENVLSKTNYLEHFSKQNINLFKCEENEILRVVVQINKPEFDFFDKDDYQWFIDNTTDESIQFFKGVKKYDQARSLEIFDLIKKGSVISDGKLYESIYNLIR